MPQFTVPLEGGGEMRVNASSPQAAADNVRSQGGTPAGSGGGGGPSGGGGGGGGGGSVYAPQGTVSDLGGGNYATVNGVQTIGSMASQLKAVGYNGPTDPASIQAAYARTATAPSGGGGSPGAPGAPGALPNTGQLGVNPTNLANTLSNLQAKAMQEYYNAKLALDTDQEAYQKAAQAIANELSIAGVTGTYQGQPTQAAIKQLADIAQQQAQTMIAYAQQFGVWGTPAAGQPTLAQQAQQAQQTGYYTPYTYTPGATPQTAGSWTAGTPVMTTAYQQQQQQAAQNYLQLLSGLRGPADWAQYQKVLGATPQGTRDLVAAAAGQYIPGRGATTGVQPQAASLQSLYDQATGASGGSQADLSAMQNTLVAPNQMAPQTWNALTPSQQQMLIGVWESQGYSKDDAQALFNQSLPKYGASAPTAGAYRLV